MAKQLDMDGLIDYLSAILSKQFSNQVSQIYYGDIGIYLPSSFGSSRRDQKAVIALSPVYNRLLDDQRVAVFENRVLGVDIITMVNITPFFSANPQEAYGERMLVNLTTAIATYLTQTENEDLGGRVQYAKVGDINWAWMARRDQALRGAAVSYEARVRIPRIV
jgi:hypothetical protein